MRVPIVVKCCADRPNAQTAPMCVFLLHCSKTTCVFAGNPYNSSMLQCSKANKNKSVQTARSSGAALNYNPNPKIQE
jgi:hypothetical protein